MPKQPGATVFGFVGPESDGGTGPERWDRWRPSVSVVAHDDFPVARFHLLHEPRFEELGSTLEADIAKISPTTRVTRHRVDLQDPWDFAEVYGALFDLLRGFALDPDRFPLFAHTTTATHTIQICWFLLTESRHLPGRLLQTYPDPAAPDSFRGRYRTIDLRLDRYRALSRRFAVRVVEDTELLRSSIDTRNRVFNGMIEEIHRVAARSDVPILLTGETGTGKSLLARRIHEVKRKNRRLDGELHELNCATLRGDVAQSALFGHVRGAFTGAVRARKGILELAHGGLVFLDEIADLGLDEQAMLLRALEEHRFLPVGSEREVQSDFQLVCATNRDLESAVAAGRFRDDLYARIAVEHFHLPPLRERLEDLPGNLEHELQRLETERNRRYEFDPAAEALLVRFARSPEAVWTANFRDLRGAMDRLANRCPEGRIGVDAMQEEIGRLRARWAPRRNVAGETGDGMVDAILGPAEAAALDAFDRRQLAHVLDTVVQAGSLSEAGRRLFAESRRRKRNPNDADRVRRYLARFGITWDRLRDHLG